MLRSGLRASVMVGGVKVDRHVRELMSAGGPDILVATPGRCMELLTEQGPDVAGRFRNVQVRKRIPLSLVRALPVFVWFLFNYH